MSDVKEVQIAEISPSCETQTRVSIRQATIDSYAEAMRRGATFPAIVVFQEREGLYWIADGFHRLAAWQRWKPDITSVSAIVRQGTKRDALLYSAGANATHGLPRSKADKRRCVEMLLADSEWYQWSDSVIAHHAQVSRVFIAKMRHVLGIQNSAPNRRSSNGRIMNTTNSGRGGNHYHRKLSSIVAALEGLDSKIDEHTELRSAQTLLRQASRQIITAMERAASANRAT